MNLEHTYRQYYASFTAVNIENEGIKYCGLDSTRTTYLMYNMDYSIWKQITLPVFSGQIVGAANYPSKYLFNTDGNVEIIVEYYKPASVPLSHLEIVSENGTSIQSINNGQYVAQIFNSGSGAKAIVWSQSGGLSSVNIYSLPGNYTGAALKTSLAGMPVSDVSILPNPVERVANVRYTLAAGQTSGQINIFDAAGRIIRTVPISGNSGSVTLDVAGWAPGVYSYSAGGPAEMFIVK